jgi:hypothetical protein
MKKILLAGLITVSLSACNNSGESTENKKDSLDSIAREQKNMIDSTAERKEDKIDSATERKKDSLERKDSMKRENRKDTSKKY